MSMADLKGKRGKRAIGWCLLALFLFWITFIGNKGFFALVSMQREKWSLERQIRELTVSNKEMEARAKGMDADLDFYEKIAREKLMLVRPGDIIYRFNEE